MLKHFIYLTCVILLLSLVACNAAVPTPSPTPAPTANPAPSLTSTPQQRIFLMQFKGFSMEPNFHDGQFVEVEAVSVSELRRGDVIVFTRFKNDERQWLKRLIGLPGETVEIHSGKVLVNGKPLDEPYINISAESNYYPITLKSDEYFVLSDNRNNGSDSRGFGPIPGANIRGRVMP